MTTPRTPARSRLVLVGAATAALVVVPVAAASAHVHVHADSTAAGAYAELTFRVPNESTTAGTTGVEVDLPTDTPLSYVATRPVPGWTAVVTEGDLPEPVDVDGTTLTKAPTSVTWTADPGTQLAPGQYQEFAISAGPLPDEGTELVLPAHQTYSDGTVVDWDEVAEAGAAEPENPAPELTTTAAAGDDDAMAGDEAMGGSGDADRSSLTTTSDGDTTARWLGGGGLALGAAALVISLVRRRAAR